VKVGLTLPHYDFSLPGEDRATFAATAAWAVRAEELGFDSAWMSDHFVYSLGRYGGPDAAGGALEPLTTIAGLAVRTARIRLGTLVLGAPFRDAVMTAHLAKGLAAISGGRFDLGIGAGWYAEDFEPFGYAFGSVGERFRLLEELRAAIDPTVGPAGVPVWIGAKGGDRALRLVARRGDGWNTAWRWTPERYGERVARLRTFVEEVGGRPPRLSLGLYAIVGEDEADLARRWAAISAWLPGAAGDLAAWREDALVGTIDEAVERLRAFAALGVEEVIVAPATVPFAVPDPSNVDLIARELLPRVAGL
jgi:alkanesulfonate monooxygenase SsuD/methylene tetrahydromethanopterin reductase-like flavin-dependent oxidoreductase (luciferase family)